MKKIPTRPSKVAGVTILLLAFFIWGNFSWAQGDCTAEQQAADQYALVAGTCKKDCALENLQPGITQQNCTEYCAEDIQNAADYKATYDDCVANNAQTTTTNPTTTDAEGEACSDTNVCPTWYSCVSWKCAKASTDTNNCAAQDSEWVSEWANNACPTWYEPVAQGCCWKTATTTTPWLPEDQNIMGMTIWPKCLLNGQCKFNIYDALGIRTSVRNEGDPTSVGIFVQDIVLSATMFIGTIVTIAIIVSGLMWIFAWASGKDPTKAKSWLINALIGLLIVVSSYLIIRLVQYIAKWF